MHDVKWKELVLFCRNVSKIGYYYSFLQNIIKVHKTKLGRIAIVKYKLRFQMNVNV